MLKLMAVMSACLLASSLSYAQVVLGDDYAQLTDYLSAEKANLISSVQEVSRQPLPTQTSRVADESSVVARLRAKATTEQAGLERFLTNQQVNEAELVNELKRLQDASFSHRDDSSLQARINQLKKLSAVNSDVLALIEENLTLVAQYQRALAARAHALSLLTLQQQADVERQQLEERRVQLVQARLALYKDNAILARQKIPASPLADEELNKDQLISYNNQRIALLDDELTLLRGRITRMDANLHYVHSPDINTLEQLINSLAHIHEQNGRILTSWASAPVLRCERLGATEVLQACANARHSRLLLQKQLQAVQQSLATELQTQQRLLRKQLASRKSLIDFSWQAWIEVARQLAQMPLQCYVYLASLMASVFTQYNAQDSLENGLFLALQCGLLSVGFYLRRRLARYTPDRARSRLSAHLYDGLLSLIYRNVPAITFMSLLLSTLWFNQVPYAHYRLLMHLVLVWFFTRQLILIARLTLLERLTDAAGHDVALYYRLRWLLLMGGWSTAVMIYSHELPLSFLLQDIFDRVFMLFILAVSLVVWQSRDAVYYVFPAIVTSRKPYLRHAVYLLGILVPLTLLTTALLGLMGYVNLAWTMSRYEAYFLAFVVSYVLLRGVIRDALDLVCEWMVSSLHNGWLWVEALLKPLDKLLRFSLFVSFVLFFLYWVGLLADAKFIAEVDTLVHYPLINFAGVYITLFSLAEFIALLLIFIWATKWSREFCYRWLYARVTDPGVRNSFAVFSQYAVVLFGCFVTLRVLGIDFTGMMVVLGGLAVGMGFGLRDFASNIVGGLMLLIERPVREGDLITIGEHEGRVAHIGIRSMRVSSWDNMEVLVPNAETFNKPFTNWTHQDSVVRTVVPIKVSRADNPMFIQSLIHAVLAET